MRSYRLDVGAGMPTFVLVGGERGAGAAWRGCSLKLGTKYSFTPTLTGVGERSHLLKPDVNLDTHILDIVNEMRWQELKNVVLVGHSYAGMVVAERNRLNSHVANLEREADPSEKGPISSLVADPPCKTSPERLTLERTLPSCHLSRTARSSTPL
jgi:hypothetical protein